MALVSSHFEPNSIEENYQTLIYEYITNEEKVSATRHAIAMALYSQNKIITMEGFDSFTSVLKLDYQRQFRRTKLFKEFHVGSNCKSIAYNNDMEFFEEGQRLTSRAFRGK